MPLKYLNACMDNVNSIIRIIEERDIRIFEFEYFQNSQFDYHSFVRMFTRESNIRYLNIRGLSSNVLTIFDTLLKYPDTEAPPTFTFRRDPSLWGGGGAISVHYLV
ncbi:hypothetical protein Y032_0314g2214 [Ancylostoma ceylanicum]|uniref:Uncharacterized protein n=1 Tax=Ancylostoma ceylanicum TaxID=53326 RepID=A0A016S2K5_9BILA|nr:hypothetical protein Y032_0314g2214 [Ancylostoma ceylanicum]